MINMPVPPFSDHHQHATLFRLPRIVRWLFMVLVSSARIKLQTRVDGAEMQEGVDALKSRNEALSLWGLVWEWKHRRYVTTASYIRCRIEAVGNFYVRFARLSSAEGERQTGAAQV